MKDVKKAECTCLVPQGASRVKCPRGGCQSFRAMTKVSENNIIVTVIASSFLFKTDSWKDSAPLKTDWPKPGQPAESRIVITATWHQTSHRGEAVPAITLGHTDMIMILISKFLFFHLRLTVDNIIMYLIISEHSDVKINKCGPLKSLEKWHLSCIQPPVKRKLPVSTQQFLLRLIVDNLIWNNSNLSFLSDLKLIYEILEGWFFFFIISHQNALKWFEVQYRLSTA